MQLKIGTSVIPLAPGISLPLVLRSPLFLTDEGKIPGSYIFNTAIPSGEAIRTVFNQAHRVQRHGRETAQLPYVITSGSLRYTGNCIVTKADAETYEVSFLLDNGDLANKLKDKTLKDLDLGGDRVLTELPCAIGENENTTHYSHRQSTAFTHEEALQLTRTVIDSTNSLAAGDACYTVPVTGTYNLEASFNVFQFATPIKLMIYKNGSLLEEIPLLSSILENRLNAISASWDLVVGDFIQFKWYFTSIPVSADAIIDVTIDKNFLLSFCINNALFGDVVNGNQETFDYAIFPIINADFLSNFPDDQFNLDNISIKTIYSNYFPVLNYWKNGKFPLFLSGSIEGEDFNCSNLFTPFVYLRTLLQKIASEAGFTIENNPFDSPNFYNAVLFNAYAENTYFTENTSILPVKQTFNLTDHVPALSQTDFIKWVSLLTGYMPIVNNNTLTLRFVDLKNKHIVSSGNTAISFPGTLLPNPEVTIEPEYKGIKLELKKAGTDKYLERIKELNEKLIYKGEVATLTSLPSSGNQVNDMYLVTSLNEYYVFQYNPETYSLTWWFFSKKFPITYTEGTEPYLQVSTELCPVLTTRILDETLGAPANRIWNIPRTDQAGILEGFPDSLGAEYGLQVLYYKGMTLDIHDLPYPLGSCWHGDYICDPNFFTDLSADSLFENRYKQFLRWLAYDTKPATFKAIITRGQLKKLSFDQIYSGNGFNFLIKEVRINLLVDGLSMAEVDVYTC